MGTDNLGRKTSFSMPMGCGIGISVCTESVNQFLLACNVMSILATTPSLAASSPLVKSFRKQESGEKYSWAIEVSLRSGGEWELQRTNKVEKNSLPKRNCFTTESHEKRCSTCGLRMWQCSFLGL